jgi:hypothetical protein
MRTWIHQPRREVVNDGVWNLEFNTNLAHIIEKLDLLIGSRIDDATPVVDVVEVQYIPLTPRSILDNFGKRIEFLVICDTMSKKFSSEEMIMDLVGNGHRIKARIARNIRYIKTNFLELFRIVRSVPNPGENDYYLYKGVIVISSPSNLAIHSHGY